MRRLDRRSLAHWASIVAVLAIVGWVLFRVQIQADRVDALSTALTVEQEALEDRGETPVAPPPDDLIEDPDYTGPPGPQGPPPSDEQVAAAVADYFERNPVEDGESPSPAAIAAAVANYLAENPPEQGEPGPPPTAAQVAAAVEAYLIANPPSPGPAGQPGEDGSDGKDGQDGAQGAPGRAPTAAEIAAAVEAYIEEHPLPMCPQEWPAAVREVLTTNGPAEQLGCFEPDQEE